MNATRIFVALTSLVLLGGSCKKSEADPTPDVCSALDQRASAISTAATTYSTNPSKANCDAYKKAVSDYIDAAANCPGVSQTDINNARNSVRDIVCQ